MEGHVTAYLILAVDCSRGAGCGCERRRRPSLDSCGSGREKFKVRAPRDFLASGICGEHPALPRWRRRPRPLSHPLPHHLRNLLQSPKKPRNPPRRWRRHSWLARASRSLLSSYGQPNRIRPRKETNITLTGPRRTGGAPTIPWRRQRDGASILQGRLREDNEPARGRADPRDFVCPLLRRQEQRPRKRKSWLTENDAANEA